jgi:glycyl-tRNA synthetase beta chain
MKFETLLVELGTEELPPKSLKTLGLAFRNGVVNGLKARELPHGSVQWFASPRRLAVLIEEVALQAPDKDLEILGPPADRARDESGAWTPAATGFARKQGVAPEQLINIDTGKGPRLGLRKSEQGQTLKSCFNAIINESVQQLPIAKRMRWGASRIEFVRPVQWLVAMIGADADHGEVLGLTTSNTTRGHRFHSTGPIVLASPEDYVASLTAAKVVASYDQRRQMIREQVETEASALSATAVIDEDLLDEVTGLVEWPVALTGSFDRQFLDVPAEALISSMKEHQKYFHLVDAQGSLLPNFITLSNIESENPALVIEGNERVIRPRLSDAAFFYETDKQTSLADRVDSLGAVVFQQKLGTLLEKTHRVQTLAQAIAKLIGADPELAGRAALLSKTDLISDMVQEFSEMQGVAGSYYALNDGEPAEVAAAIAQHYWPKFSGDQLPQSATATCLALADRLDTLVGIFGIGQPPTGSKDPFALRRASLAILRILVENQLDLDLAECLALASAQYDPAVLAADTDAQVLDYMIERFRARYEESNIPAEIFKSVSALGLSHPLDIQRRVLAVDAFAKLDEAASLAAANKRVRNILGKLDTAHQFGEVNANLLVETEEKGLFAALDAAAETSGKHFSQGQYQQALASLAILREPVDAFFDGVMVNSEDPALRTNRLNLLYALRQLFLQVADISQLVVSK